MATDGFRVIDAIVELPRIANRDDILINPNTDLPSPLFVPPHASTFHAGEIVVANQNTNQNNASDGSQNLMVRKFNGDAWEDLGFPATSTWAAPGSGLLAPAPRNGSIRVASDDATLWVSIIVDEELDFGSYLYDEDAPSGDTWFSGSTYVFAWDGGVWNVVYYRKAATLNGPRSGPVVGAVGTITHDLASHPGAGYCWEVSAEGGYRGGNIGSPFTVSLVIAAQVGPGGLISESYGFNYGGPSEPENTGPYPGIYYGPDNLYDPVDPATTFGGEVRVVATESGRPIAVVDTLVVLPGSTAEFGFPAGPTYVISVDDMAVIQDIFPYSVDSSYKGGRLWLGMEAPEDVQESFFYPEEVPLALTFVNQAEVLSIPFDGVAHWQGLTNNVGENVQLVKNPLLNTLITDFSGTVAVLAAVTNGKRAWVARQASDGLGGIMELWTFNTCPLPNPQHGRYAWGVAEYSDRTATPGVPARITPGFVSPTYEFAYGLETLYDPQANRIYAIAWSNAPDGEIYLRCWYWQICCTDCIKGMHVWDRI